jgi:hypothetical protein
MTRTVSTPVVGGRWRAAGAADLERAIIIALVGLGLVIRARGYLFKTEPFWLDECGWARRLLTRSLFEFDIRPIGFMAVTRGIVHIFSSSEAWFRFLPWCGGVAILVTTPFIARLLLQSAAARLLLVASVAVHPGAIDLSKEFKPYSVGLAIHGALLLFALRYSITGRARDLLLALVLAVPGVLFAQDVLFAYPGLFLVLAFSALRARRLRHLVSIGAGGAAAFVLTFCLYTFMWKGASTSQATEFWANKYDVFYERAAGDTARQQIQWFVRKYADLAALPGMRREFWKAQGGSVATLDRLRLIDVRVWLALNIAGLACMVRKRRLVAGLLLVVPVVTLTAFNALRFWPFGAFRTNLFALAYMGPIAAFGVELVADALGQLSPRLALPFSFAPVLLLVAAPLLAFDRSLGGAKRAFANSSEFPAAVERLLELQTNSSRTRREPVVFDEYTCRSWAFYSKLHSRFSDEVTPRLMEHFSFSPKCRPGDSFRGLVAEVRHGLQKSSRVWIVAESAAAMDAIDHAWPTDLGKIVREVSGESRTMVLCVHAKD